MAEAYQKALEEAYLGRLRRVDGGYAEVPTILFVGRIDVKMSPPPDIDFFEQKNGRVVLFRRSTEACSPLALSNRENVLVRERDLAAVQKFAETQMIAPGKSGLSVEKRMESVRKVAIDTVDRLFDQPTEENIKESQKMVGSFVYLLMKEPRSFLVLSRLSSHDPYTLQHSVGTAVNAIILTRKSGITDEELIAEAGMAGLLHDIGKVKIDPQIINKKGPLNDSEWDVMRQHSADGFEIIKSSRAITDRVKLAVLEHHEDKKGTGYPNRLNWTELGSLSKIVGVCDIFNALTTNRSYAKARSPFDALQLMQAKLQEKMDIDLFKNLVLIYGGKIEDIEP